MSDPNPESLPIIADYGVKSVLRQLTEADGLVGRGYQIAGFASVVLGLASIASGGPQWLLAVIIVAYFAAVAVCFWVVWPRIYESPGSADDLWRLHYDNPPLDLWHALAANSATAYRANAATTELRWKVLAWGLVALAIESVFVGVRLLWAA